SLCLSYCTIDTRHLPSLPTRRSSDLPYGDVLRNLTEEEEDRYLALQERVSKHANDPAAFKSDRHRMPSGDFSIVEGRMVANGPRSEEHTSELQSRENLVCRLLLEKKK